MRLCSFLAFTIATLLFGCGAPPTASDAGMDGGPDMDASDASTDAGTDAGELGAVALRFPWNGYATGSPHAPAGAAAEHPLRPKLIWEASPGAREYQVQMEDGCAYPGFRACAFESPELDARTAETTFRPEAPLPVSLEAPVGRRYAWRVRGCDAERCGPWSEPRYLEVGRQDDDLNGDGYAELIVGASFQASPEGREGNVFLYLGGPDGPTETPDLVLDNPDDEPLAYFGRSAMGVGDVDGDGFADLLVGAPRQDTPTRNEGNAFLYLGGPDGPSPAPDFVFDNPTGQEDARFGIAVAGPGDINGDGFADLVVGAFLESEPEEEEGNAFVFYGGPEGPALLPDLRLDNPDDQPFGYFGSAVSGAGDVDGDGYPDLLITAYGQDRPEREEGNAFLYRGGPDGPSPEPDQIFDNPTGLPAGAFGYSARSAGDLNGDGYADFVIGAPSQDSPESNEGSAFVYYGGPAGPRERPDLALDNPADQENGRFGYAVSGAGDLNGDGYDDLVVGAHSQSDPELEEGAAFVYYGGPEGPSPEPDLALDNPYDKELGAFGAAVACAGDVDGDGYVELIVGAYLQPAPEVDEGNAYLYRGGPSGPATEPDLALDNPTDQTEGRFGWSVD